MEFVDMTIEAASAERRLVDKAWQIVFTVRVVDSPAGGMSADQTVSQSYASRSLHDSVAELEQGKLDQTAIMTLGRTLGALLLPDQPSPVSMYDLFLHSLDLLGPDRGLRLRLRLPPLLAALPWEYLYLDRAGNPDSIDGFLALNPRVAIVRDEIMPTPSTLVPLSGTIKVVAALASADGLAPLDLDKEEANLHHALDGATGLKVHYLKDATLDEVLAQIHGAGVFHYAGHGAFERKAGDAPGTYSGKGALALLDQVVDADQLAVNLSAGGVLLAMLGGCETGRRDGVSVWSGIAPALVRAHAQIPAVIANQFAIKDVSAIAFSKALYRALVGGLSVEEAVAVGRIAIYNADKRGHDWGVPVLYLRPGDGHLFRGADDQVLRQEARSDAEVAVRLQAKHISNDGYLAGAEVGTMRAGRLVVTVKLGDVAGTAIGMDIKTVEGGSAQADMEAETVSGTMVGARIGSLGGGTRQRGNRRKDETAARSATNVKTRSRIEAEATARTEEKK